MSVWPLLLLPGSSLCLVQHAVQGCPALRRRGCTSAYSSKCLAEAQRGLPEGTGHHYRTPASPCSTASSCRRQSGCCGQPMPPPTVPLLPLRRQQFACDRSASQQSHQCVKMLQRQPWVVVMARWSWRAGLQSSTWGDHQQFQVSSTSLHAAQKAYNLSTPLDSLQLSVPQPLSLTAGQQTRRPWDYHEQSVPLCSTNGDSQTLL